MNCIWNTLEILKYSHNILPAHLLPKPIHYMGTWASKSLEKGKRTNILNQSNTMTGMWISPHPWMYFLKNADVVLRDCHRKTPSISNKVRSNPRQSKLSHFQLCTLRVTENQWNSKTKITSFVPGEQEGSRQQPDTVHQRSTVSVSVVPDVPLHPGGLLKANLNVYTEKH